jgi:hypothetical protein
LFLGPTIHQSGLILYLWIAPFHAI